MDAKKGDRVAFFMVFARFLGVKQLTICFRHVFCMVTVPFTYYCLSS